MSGAIRQGSGGPPELGEFWIEQELWQRFGLTKETARQRPTQELRDKLDILNMIAREEQAQQKKK